MERIRPKLRLKTGTVEHGMNGVGDSSMPLFNCTILIGCVGTSGAYFKLVLVKNLTNFRVVVQFSSLVQIGILLGNLWRMMLKKMA